MVLNLPDKIKEKNKEELYISLPTCKQIFTTGIKVKNTIFVISTRPLYNLLCVLCPQANQEDHQSHGHPEIETMQKYECIIAVDVHYKRK